MNDPMNIALVSRYYPPDPGGGLAIYTQQVAQAMAARGHQVYVIAAQPQHVPWDATQPTITREYGVTILRVPQLKVYERSLFGTTCLYNSNVIAQSIRELHATTPLNVVHAPVTFFESYTFGRVLKQQLKIPLVVKFHENQETYRRIEGRFKAIKRFRRERMRSLMCQVAQDADMHLGVSGHALDSMQRYLGLRSGQIPGVVSPSAIDLDMFYPRMDAPPPDVDFGGILANNVPFIFYSGRLIHEKGLHLLVEAFLAILSEAYPDLHLVITGEFDYRQPHYEAKIRRMLDGHAAASRVVFTGRVAYREMPWWYSRCKLFVGPSFCEPFGRVFLEAMACEAPIVAFNSGGPQEFIQHGRNGYLVNTQAIWALGQAILTLLDKPELGRHFGMMGRETVAELYSLDAVTDHLLDCYVDVARPKRRPRVLAGV